MARTLMSDAASKGMFRNILLVEEARAQEILYVRFAANQEG